MKTNLPSKQTSYICPLVALTMDCLDPLKSGYKYGKSLDWVLDYFSFSQAEAKEVKQFGTRLILFFKWCVTEGRDMSQ